MCGVWRAPITAVQSWGKEYRFLQVEAPGMAAESRPGQFVMASVATTAEFPYPLLKRALAIYDLPESGSPGQLSLMIKVVGDGTRALASAGPGEPIDLVGPLGNGFDLELSEGCHCLLVAGGIGIASLLLLARRLLQKGRPVTLLYGGRKASDLVGLEDFEKLGIPVLLTTEDGSRGLHGKVTLALEQVLAGGGQEWFCYTCGPNPMMEAVTRVHLARGIPGQVSVESKMACGFGVCLGCTVLTSGGFRLACSHGPVFSAAEFVWEGKGILPDVLAQRGISR